MTTPTTRSHMYSRVMQLAPHSTHFHKITYSFKTGSIKALGTSVCSCWVMIRLKDVPGSALALLVTVLLHVHLASGAGRKTLCFQSDNSEQSIYDFTLMDVHKERMVNLSSYANQVNSENMSCVSCFQYRVRVRFHNQFQVIMCIGGQVHPRCVLSDWTITMT